MALLCPHCYAYIIYNLNNNNNKTIGMIIIIIITMIIIQNIIIITILINDDTLYTWTHVFYHIKYTIQ